MNYIGVSELKNSKSMWEMLQRDNELILTKDGKPGALILPVTPEGVEGTLRAVRRALFSETVSAIRSRASGCTSADIDHEINAVRRDRK
jgi:antitoxin (DNA-binding transcriptional repressor) of toxin-antitoxin stability system